LKQEVDSYLSRFEAFDPATLYEASGLQDMVDPAIRPSWPGAKVCGRALTVECPPGDNLGLHQAVAIAGPGNVLVATTGCHLAAGAWGEILTVAAQVRGIGGLIIDGAVRDIVAIAALKFPIFSRGLAIGACTKKHAGILKGPVMFGGVTVRTGDIVFGDADGLVILAQERADEIYELACQRQRREASIMEQLRAGRTTLEILGLPAAGADR
jgi:4-hydroxy-4-methyl-2-oxoglutarate aldolase